MGTPNSWSIDFSSGHCSHTDGIDAYICRRGGLDFVPILGPYTSRPFKQQELATTVRQLIASIEQEGAKEHVVFGSLSRSGDGLQVEALGLKKYWLPIFSARSQWLHLNNHEMSPVDLKKFLIKEWAVGENGREIRHSNGVVLQYSDSCFNHSLARMFRSFEATFTCSSAGSHLPVDSENRDAEVHNLGNIGFKSLCSLQNYKIAARIIRILEQPLALTSDRLPKKAYYLQGDPKDI